MVKSPATQRPTTRPLAERAREAPQLRHLRPRTQDVYLGWMRRYHEFNHRKDPALFGAERVRAKRPQRLPVVLSRDEVRAVINELEGVPRLMAMLLYGVGLRLLECCRLRVKDLDFQRSQLIVREGKGDKDRVTLLPTGLHAALRAQLEAARAQHQADLDGGAGWVELPHALDRKLPGEGRSWLWQWVFPATRTYVHQETGQVRRHHLHEAVVQGAVKNAVRASGISKRATCHTPACAFRTQTGRSIAAGELGR